MKKILLVLLFWCAVTVFPLPEVLAEKGAAPHYIETRISEGIEAGPGAVSWSPDGKRLAYVDHSLHIYDVERRERKEVRISGPRYIVWGEGDEIFVIYGEDGRRKLCAANARSLSLRKVNLDIEPAAVFPVRGTHRLLVVTSEMKVMTFGTEVNFTVFLYDPKDGSTRNIFASDKIFPSRKPDVNLLSGWMHAGINSLDGSLMFMEHAKPPAWRGYYSKVIGLDAATGKAVAITGEEAGYKNAFVSGSWSPDGRRLALTDGDGLLEIFDIDGGRPLVVNVRGLYPSWNPEGSQIYSGGFIVDSDGKKSEALLHDAFASLSEWSPDGRRLAVVSSAGLSLFEGFDPHFAGPDKPFDSTLSGKILLLKELLRDRLINEEEYARRYAKLMEGVRN